jgi:hypothetical protein
MGFLSDILADALRHTAPPDALPPSEPGSPPSEDGAANVPAEPPAIAQVPRAGEHVMEGDVAVEFVPRHAEVLPAPMPRAPHVRAEVEPRGPLEVPLEVPGERVEGRVKSMPGVKAMPGEKVEPVPEAVAARVAPVREAIPTPVPEAARPAQAVASRERQTVETPAPAPASPVPGALRASRQAVASAESQTVGTVRAGPQAEPDLEVAVRQAAAPGQRVPHSPLPGVPRSSEAVAPGESQTADAARRVAPVVEVPVRPSVPVTEASRPPVTARPRSAQQRASGERSTPGAARGGAPERAGRGAVSSSPAPEASEVRSEPRVHIGSVQVIVSSPTVESPSERSGDAGFLHRRYLRSL